jgi:hypothetical protein
MKYFCEKSCAASPGKSRILNARPALSRSFFTTGYDKPIILMRCRWPRKPFLNRPGSSMFCSHLVKLGTGCIARATGAGLGDL